MSKKAALIEIINLQEKADRWLDTVPKEINEAFFDNPYTTSLGLQLDVALKCLFPEEELDWVCWALYEWREGLGFQVDDGAMIYPKSKNDALDILFDMGIIKE